MWSSESTASGVIKLKERAGGSLCSSEICLKWTTRHLVHLVVSSNSEGAIYAAGGCDEGLPRMPCVESFCSAKNAPAGAETAYIVRPAKLYCFQGCKVNLTRHTIAHNMDNMHLICINHWLFLTNDIHAISCLAWHHPCQVEGHLAVGRGLTTALCAEPVIDVPWLRDPLVLNHERLRTNESAASHIVVLLCFVILRVNLFLLLSWVLWLLLLVWSLFL